AGIVTRLFHVLLVFSTLAASEIAVFRPAGIVTRLFHVLLIFTTLAGSEIAVFRPAGIATMLFHVVLIFTTLPATETAVPVPEGCTTYCDALVIVLGPVPVVATSAYWPSFGPVGKLRTAVAPSFDTIVIGEGTVFTFGIGFWNANVAPSMLTPVTVMVAVVFF